MPQPVRTAEDVILEAGLFAGKSPGYEDLVPGETPSSIPRLLRPVAKVFGLYNEAHEKKVQALIAAQQPILEGWKSELKSIGKELARGPQEPTLGQIANYGGGMLPRGFGLEQSQVLQPRGVTPFPQTPLEAQQYQEMPIVPPISARWAEQVGAFNPAAIATPRQAAFVSPLMEQKAVLGERGGIIPTSLAKPPKELTAKEEIVEIGGVGYQPKRNEDGTIMLSPLAGQTAKPPEPPKPVSDENRIALEKYGKGFQELDQKEMHQVNTQLFDEKKTLADFRVTAQAMAQVATAGQVAEIQQRARNKVDQEIRVAGPRQILKQWDDMFAQVKRPNAPDLFLREGAGYFAQLKNGGKIWLENMQGIDDRLAMMEAIGTGFRANYVRLTGDVGNFSAVEQENASRYLIPRIWTPADPLRAPDSYERAKKKIDLLRQFVTVVENAAGNPANVKIVTRAQLLEILGKAQLVDRAGQQKEIQDMIEKAKPK